MLSKSIIIKKINNLDKPALRGEPLPDDLSLPEQMYYLSVRRLYKDWKATIRNWETRNRSSAPAPRQAPQSRPEPQTDSSLDVDEWERMAQEFDPQMLLDDLENFEEGGQLHDL